MNRSQTIDTICAVSPIAFGLQVSKEWKKSLVVLRLHNVRVLSTIHLYQTSFSCVGLKKFFQWKQEWLWRPEINTLCAFFLQGLKRVNNDFRSDRTSKRTWIPLLLLAAKFMMNSPSTNEIPTEFIVRVKLNVSQIKKTIVKLRQSCNSFCMQRLQMKHFECIIATDNFCLHHGCLCIIKLHFYAYTIGADICAMQLIDSFCLH